MENTPDLSKLVSLIMQNPSLVAEISELAKPKPEDTPTSTDVAEPQETSASEAVITEQVDRPSRKIQRSTLLNAMKPYLSESRRNAIDSMSSILEVIEAMAQK